MAETIVMIHVMWGGGWYWENYKNFLEQRDFQCYTPKGYKCDKYLFTFKNKQMGTMTQWFSIKLGYLIKIVNKTDMMGEVITELQNIKKASVRDDLFIVPSDYQEMPHPQIPQMPTENQ